MISMEFMTNLDSNLNSSIMEIISKLRPKRNDITCEIKALLNGLGLNVSKVN